MLSAYNDDSEYEEFEEARVLEHYRDPRSGRSGWMYRSDTYFMMTIKLKPNLPAMSDFDPNGFMFLKNDWRWRWMSDAVCDFCTRSEWARYIWEFRPYIIMPDHIHMIVRLHKQTDVPLPPGESVLTIMQRLRAYLNRAYRELFRDDPRVRDCHQVFRGPWYDYAVTREGQLANFRNYIWINAEMGLLHRRFAERFEVMELARHWRLMRHVWMLGNPEILNCPDIRATLFSRSVKPGSPEWEANCRELNGWQPGVCAASCFWSPMEQEAQRIMIANRGFQLVFCPNGFRHVQVLNDGRTLRWHPYGREMNIECAGSRVLFISLVPPNARLDRSKQAMRERCLECNRLVRQIAAAVSPFKGPLART